jgi:hypothetical protein
LCIGGGTGIALTEERWSETSPSKSFTPIIWQQDDGHYFSQLKSTR